MDSDLLNDAVGDQHEHYHQDCTTLFIILGFAILNLPLWAEWWEKFSEEQRQAIIFRLKRLPMTMAIGFVKFHVMFWTGALVALAIDLSGYGIIQLVTPKNILDYISNRDWLSMLLVGTGGCIGVILGGLAGFQSNRWPIVVGAQC